MVQHVAVFPHSVYYPDNEGITLSDIANTLLAHEKLVAIIPEILADLAPGLVIEKIEIRLERATIGSLNEAFFVALFATFQQRIDEELPKVIEALTGVRIPEEYDTLVTVILFIIVYAAFRKIWERNPGKGLPPSMQGDHNTYVNIAGDMIGQPPERIEEAVDRAFTKKRKTGLQRAAIDLWRPAKRGGSGRIQPRGLPEVSRRSVEELPDEIAFSEPNSEAIMRPYEDVLLSIRATDRDRGDHGWWGRALIDGIETRRLPLTITPSIDLNMIASVDHVRADIVLEIAEDDEGERKARRIHVMKADAVP